MSSVENETGRNGGKGGKGLVIGVIVAVVVIIALVAVIVVLVTKKDNGSGEPAVQEAVQEKRNVVVTEDNVEEVIQQREEAEFVEPGYYTVTMNNEWHFPDGKSASTDAYVENVPENTNDVYFDIFLAGDEENAVYESPVIQRGASLDSITLKTPLDAGTYDCVMVYHLVDDDQNTISTLRVAVTLIIEG